MRRLSILLVMILFSSCTICREEKKALSKQEYNKIISESFDNISDVMKFFPVSVEDVNKRVEYSMEMVKENLGKVLLVYPNEATFENTARPLDDTARKFYFIESGFHIIEMTHPDKALRDACRDAAIKMSKFGLDWFYKPGLYKAFKNYIKNRSEKENLSDEQKYFLKEHLRYLEKNGLHFEKEKLEKVKKLKKEIVELESEFSKNIAEDKSFILVDKAALAGTSDHFINALEKDESGKYKLTCAYPIFFEIMDHCSVSKTRKDLSRKFKNRAYPANKSVLESLIEKRDRLAKLLGFESYAHYDIGDQMAGNDKVAKRFIKDLFSRAKDKAEREVAMLMADLPEGITLLNGKFRPEDISRKPGVICGYVIEQYKKKHFDFDEREVAEYFTMEKTIDGIFDIYQKFLGLKFRLVKPDGLWHEDISFIEICKKDSDLVEGYVMLDLHPRENKYSHACCVSIVTPMIPKAGKKLFPSISSVIANFPKSTKDRPSLLSHNDVLTFFHEFGHAMHHFLSRTEMNRFAGYWTKVDFVEVPSQMFEQWMWDRDMLKKVSSHYQTGEPMPDSLIDKMLKLKDLLSGLRVVRQSKNSLISLKCFKSGPYKDLDKINRDYFEKYSWYVNMDEQDHSYASFGHLGGYGAKYYSYLWSEVIAIDFFDKVREHGLLNPEIGQELIEKAFGKGGSVDPNILVKDFLGRELSIDPFLRDLGV